MQLLSKLPDQGVTIFNTMSALAQRLNALNLSQGFPDFAAPPDLIEALCEATRNGHNQYAAGDGYLPLRQQVALQFQQRDQITLDPFTEISITLAQPLPYLPRFKPPFIRAMKSLFLTQVTTVMILRYGLQAVFLCILR